MYILLSGIYCHDHPLPVDLVCCKLAFIIDDLYNISQLHIRHPCGCIYIHVLLMVFTRTWQLDLLAHINHDQHRALNLYGLAYISVLRNCKFFPIIILPCTGYTIKCPINIIIAKLLSVRRALVPGVSVMFYMSPGWLPVLNTLQISHNHLTTADDIEELVHCRHLRCIDVYYKTTHLKQSIISEFRKKAQESKL